VIYPILVKGMTEQQATSALNRARDFLSDIGYPDLTEEHWDDYPTIVTQFHNPHPCYYELESYIHLGSNEVTEYYRCERCDIAKAFYFKYFTRSGTHVDHSGVLVLISDATLAVQLKLLLS
jgi:ketosteroid isomerase-like protein